MNILKSIIIGSIVFITFTGSLLFVKWLEKPGPGIQGEIYIDASDGERIKLSGVPILLIKKSAAQKIRHHSINKLSSLDKDLALSELIAITDPQGKFVLPARDDEYAIAVLTAQNINGERAVFFWLVEVDKDQNPPIISLNNNNLTEDFVAEELEETAQ